MPRVARMYLEIKSKQEHVRTLVLLALLRGINGAACGFLVASGKALSRVWASSLLQLTFTVRFLSHRDL